MAWREKATITKLKSDRIDVKELYVGGDPINGTDGAESIRVTNEYHVAQNGSDTTGDGSKRKPYQTISAAMTAIGDAADETEFETYNDGTYNVFLGPGSYAGFTVPRRQIVNVFLDAAAKIVGDITYPADTTLGRSSHPPKFGIYGTTLRTGLSASVPIIGIEGDIIAGSANSSFVYLLDMKNIYMTGDIIFEQPGSTHKQLWIENVSFDNARNKVGTTTYISIFAKDCNWNESGQAIRSLGAAALVGGENNIRIKKAHNCLFGDIYMADAAAKSSEIFNCVFGGDIFADGSQLDIEMDSLSYLSWQAAIDSGGDTDTSTIAVVDQSLGPSDPPASAAATGFPGEVRWDADYIYICTAADTWKRAAIATW